MLQNAHQAESTQVKPQRPASTLLLPLVVCAGVYLLGLAVPKIIGKSTFWIFLPGFFTESIFLFCSVALSAWLTKGRLPAFGFTKGAFHFKAKFFLWLLPMLVIATLQVLGSPVGESSSTAVRGSTATPIGHI